MYIHDTIHIHMYTNVCVSKYKLMCIGLFIWTCFYKILARRHRCKLSDYVPTNRST